jgi:carbonic anhydrase
MDSILNRVNISVNKHGSKLIAISGHYDCAGNPCGEEDQKEQTKQSIAFLKNLYPEAEIIGLWVNSEWKINKL